MGGLARCYNLATGAEKPIYVNSLASNGQSGEKRGERQCVLLVQSENRGIIANRKDH